MTPRRQRALEIFHAAQLRFPAPGAEKRVGSRMVQEFTCGSLTLAISRPVKPGARVLPYGLDISSGGRKLFAIRFDDKRFRVHAFKRGAWEEEIIGDDAD